MARGLRLLAFLIQGHHGGLPKPADLQTWLAERGQDPAVPAAIAAAIQALPDLAPTAPVPALPTTQFATPHQGEFFIRMLFSCLVDADFLDTERHFNRGHAAHRGGVPTLAQLWQALEASQHALSGSADDPVNQARHEVYQHCLAAADLPPGFFRLPAPTGIGKTRSSLAFALCHALRHDLRRIVYGVPYISITEQTCDVFRGVFAPAGLGDRAVLEHRSGMARRNDPQAPSAREVWERLSAENWDASLIVTTTVRLFESLLARTPSDCRRLHRLARSVIILDEVQALPTQVLEPALDVLRELVRSCGTSVLLSTATQPSLDDRRGFKGLPDIREIIPDPDAYFARLKRVTYSWPTSADERWSWARVAQEVLGERQAMAVLNTRADARAVTQALTALVQRP